MGLLGLYLCQWSPRYPNRPKVGQIHSIHSVQAPCRVFHISLAVGLSAWCKARWGAFTLVRRKTPKMLEIVKQSSTVLIIVYPNASNHKLHWDARSLGKFTATTVPASGGLCRSNKAVSNWFAHETIPYSKKNFCVSVARKCNIQDDFVVDIFAACRVAPCKKRRLDLSHI